VPEGAAYEKCCRVRWGELSDVDETGGVKYVLEELKSVDLRKSLGYIDKKLMP
jgi:hypothetical protein